MDLETLKCLLQFLRLSLLLPEFLNHGLRNLSQQPLHPLDLCLWVSAVCFLTNLNPDSRVNGGGQFHAWSHKAGVLPT